MTHRSTDGFSQSDDLLEDLRSSKLFESLRRDVDVSYISARDVRPDQVKQAFEMTKANMQVHLGVGGWDRVVAHERPPANVPLADNRTCTRPALDGDGKTRKNLRNSHHTRLGS